MNPGTTTPQDGCHKENLSLLATSAPETDLLRKSAVHLATSEGKSDICIILVLLVAAFSVRIYSLQFFHVISTDGTSYALAARALADGNLTGICSSGFYSILIAVANLFISDLETAGRIVSLVFGSLLVIPLYLLGKSIFSRNVAIAASMIAIVWPSFVSLSCEVMTQATHTTLLLSAVYLFWRAFKKPTALNGSLAGILIGITYFTRPESILLFFTMPIALFVLNPKDLRQNRLMLASYSASFLILFLANMILLHHSTGEWQFSTKTNSALNDALSYYLKIPDLGYTPGYVPKTYLNILQQYPGFIWTNIAKNLKTAWETMLPPLLWLLFAVGFITGGFSREKNRLRLFLLSTLAPIAVLIVFFYISGGYIEAYRPFMFLFAASGFVAIEEKIKAQISLSPERFRLFQRTPLLIVSAFIYAVVIFAPQIRKDISDAEYWPHTDGGRRSVKQIGLILKDKLPPGKIMTRWARIAFYSERDWANVPSGVRFDKIIQTAKEQKVRFLVADGLLFGNRPGFGEEIFSPLYNRSTPFGLYLNEDPSVRIKGLKPFLLYTNPRSVGVVVYEIL